MTEARLVTREQLAAALRTTDAEEWTDEGDHSILWGRTIDSLADAIFAALPAAAPAEGVTDPLLLVEEARHGQQTANGDRAGDHALSTESDMPEVRTQGSAGEGPGAADDLLPLGADREVRLRSGVGLAAPAEGLREALARWGPAIMEAGGDQALTAFEDDLAALARHESGGSE